MVKEERERGKEKKKRVEGPGEKHPRYKFLAIALGLHVRGDVETGDSLEPDEPFTDRGHGFRSLGRHRCFTNRARI